MNSNFRYNSNILFVELSNVKTFLCEPYLSREAEIMQSESYKSKIPDFRKEALEHNHYKYTLLTHSKVCFLKHTQQIIPNQDYYTWIDFGYPVGNNICGWPACEKPANPVDINFNLLENKIHIGATKVLEHYVTEEEFLRCNWFTFNAFSIIVHRDLLSLFHYLYKQKLEKWQSIGHADDEQNLIYQLYQDNKKLFKVFKTSESPWGLYNENLNSGKTPTILN